jgi:hypothetical protein
METPSRSYQPYVDQVIRTYASDAYRDELLRAKVEYFRQTGEVHEEDGDFFELRMASFFDWYLYERPMDGWDCPPVRRYLLDHQFVLSEDDRAVYEGLATSIHSLFVYKRRKWRSPVLVLKDLLSGDKRLVVERREWSAIERGDVFQARLIPFDGHYFFTRAFCFFPRGANRYITHEAKLARKGRGRSTGELLWRLSYLRYLQERFRHVDVRRIYSDDGMGLVGRGAAQDTPIDEPVEGT